MRAKNVETQHAVINLSGSGNVSVENLRAAQRLEVIVQGSGNALVQGQGEDGTLISSGSGNIEARSMALRGAVARVSGSGNISVNANESLDATVTSSGSVIYYGNPTVRSSVTGSGSVRRGN